MPAPEPRVIDEAFRVPRSRHLFEGAVQRSRGLLTRLSRFESRVLADDLAGVSIEQPIYVASLARAGSTLLLEVLAAHDDVATHQYRDFPLLWTPYWWHELLRRMPAQNGPASERAHGDGILVTPHSPEAMEEVLWMHFFPGAHDPDVSHWLNRETHHGPFESFYRDHLRKLLHIRGARRYAAKANYHVSRLAYLLKLFPDARLVLPVREPSRHIASLMKQHRLFCEAQRRHPRALAHMQRVGHFEFGLDRRPINLGDQQAVDAVRSLWQRGEEVRGWARYWAYLHEALADQLASDTPLKGATLVMRYETLCEAPERELRRLLEHCRLSQNNALVQQFAERIQPPTYYASNFTAEESAIIREETARAAQRFGYDP
jgi:hypothetical protein